MEENQTLGKNNQSVEFEEEVVKNNKMTSDSSPNKDSSSKNILYGKFSPSPNAPWIVRSLTKTGIIKSEKGAVALLLFIVLILIAVTVYFFVFWTKNRDNKVKDIQIKIMEQSKGK